MRGSFLIFIIFVLFPACGYHVLVPEDKFVFEQEGYLLCGYDNRWYFIPTDPCVPFGKAKIASGFPINDLTTLRYICEKAISIPGYVPGSQHKEEMTLTMAPVNIRYCYRRKAETGQETLVLRDTKVLFQFRNLRDLAVVEINPLKCDFVPN
jgi:hypothetical protein